VLLHLDVRELPRARVRDHVGEHVHVGAAAVLLVEGADRGAGVLRLCGGRQTECGQKNERGTHYCSRRRMKWRNSRLSNQAAVEPRQRRASSTDQQVTSTRSPQASARGQGNTGPSNSATSATIAH